MESALSITRISRSSYHHGPLRYGPRQLSTSTRLSIRSRLVVASSLRSSLDGSPSGSSPRPSNLGRRSFFSLADIAKFIPDAAKPGGSDSGVDVQEFHARKILPYTQEQLYSIVADIPSYSSFIPFCTSSRITSSASTSPSSQKNKPSSSSTSTRSAEPLDAQASLHIGFASFSEQFTSRVQGVPFEEVKATAVDSPLFRGLRTTWRFTPASPASPHSTATSTGLPSSADSSSPTTAVASLSKSSGPTLLTIDLAFSFVNPLHQIASQAFLPKLEELMVGAFEKRCLEVYGRGKE